MKNTLSVNRIEANRMNARKSTGPKSAEGKAMSRMNGFKHGIFAREVVLRGRDRGERGREFQDLHWSYREHFAPVGPVEEMLVERMVTTHWRLHRVLIAERGEILRSLEGADQRNQMKLMEWFPPAATAAGGSVLPKPWTYEVEEELLKARDHIRRDGELTDAVLERLGKVLEDRPTMVEALRKAREVVPDNAEGMSAEALREKRQLGVLEVLNNHLDCCENGLLTIAMNKRNKAQVHRDASLLPAQKVVTKILKYESSLERQFYRAMNQLERLQRMRKGDVVPPPTVVQVS